MSDENQHWVPKFLIRNFADSDGRVFCLHIHMDLVTKAPPKNAASEQGFNDFTLDGEAITFEDKLEKIETKAAPVLKRMIGAKSLSGIGWEERRRVADFMTAQSFRTKAFYEGLADKPNRQEFGRTFTQLWESAGPIYEYDPCKKSRIKGRNSTWLNAKSDSRFDQIGDPTWTPSSLLLIAIGKGGSSVDSGEPRMSQRRDGAGNPMKEPYT
jgi:hypothetical protein